MMRTVALTLGLMIAVVVGVALSRTTRAADAGSHSIAAGDSYTVPDTSVDITNSSLPGTDDVEVTWGDGSSDIHVSCKSDTVVSIATAGTPVVVLASGSHPSITTTGGNVTLAFDGTASRGTATLDGDSNSVKYLLGSSDNYTTCNGANNKHVSETDPDVVPGNDTTFNGMNNSAD